MRYTSRLGTKSHRNYYDGPLAKEVPTKRMGSFSAESADDELQTPQEWRQYRPRFTPDHHPRPAAQPRRS
jgi:hypothetical protein